MHSVQDSVKGGASEACSNTGTHEHAVAHTYGHWSWNSVAVLPTGLSALREWPISHRMASMKSWCWKLGVIMLAITCGSDIASMMDFGL